MSAETTSSSVPYTQANHPLAVKTPLGDDALLLIGVLCHEAISELFNIELQVIAENRKPVVLDKLLGQEITVELELPGSQTPRQNKRVFHGICNRATQGAADRVFTEYRLNVVPEVWRLTMNVQSRIFQNQSVKDILTKVLKGLDVTWALQGTYLPREYCVQYRESDFDFISRLMEEEGIYYYFDHDEDGHQMVVSDAPLVHPEVPPPTEVIFQEPWRQTPEHEDDRITGWITTQEIRSGKVTLWDHSFELTGSKPGTFQHLEATKSILGTVTDGKVSRRLLVGANGDLEIYDYPGRYAQRFDGVAAGSGDNAANLNNIFDDNKRTTEIRMQQEAVPSVLVRGVSYCRQFLSGHRFTKLLLEEGNPAPDGSYLLTSVIHVANLSAYRSGELGGFRYYNNFTATPIALPYRPLRKTPRPTIQGTQTAVVVGSGADGEEIFTDKYGRVKVQFHWDRPGDQNTSEDQGKYKNSSCWVRVATPWAGKQWGMIHIPRIGHEVVVDFQDGDPDTPLIIGSVYNAEMMPPYPLPDKQEHSGLKTRSTTKGTEDDFNELRFEDKKGEEKVYMHAQKDMEKVVENSYTLTVGPKNDLGPSHLLLVQSEKEQKLEAVVGPNSEHGACGLVMDQRTCSPLQTTLGLSIAPKHDYGPARIQMDQTLLEQKMVLEIGPKHDFGPASIAFDQTKLEQMLELKTGPGGLGPASIKFDKTMVEQYLELKLGSASIKLDQKPGLESIEIKVGSNSIKIDQMGISMKGLMLKAEADTLANWKGLITQVSADAMVQVKGGVTMLG
jgi:type VI secretion system secreted protein VgrG